MTLKNPQRFVHVITHGPRCLDGVAAAVTVARYYHDAVVLPSFCSHRQINRVLANLRCDPVEADHEVWITDISWSDPDVDRHLQALIDRGVRVYWIDHHRTALTRLNGGLINV